MLLHIRLHDNNCLPNHFVPLRSRLAALSLDTTILNWQRRCPAQTPLLTDVLHESLQPFVREQWCGECPPREPLLSIIGGELSSEQVQRVADAFARAEKESDSVIVGNAFGKVYGYDLLRLRPGRWLNDEIVNVTLALIAAESAVMNDCNRHVHDDGNQVRSGQVRRTLAVTSWFYSVWASRSAQEKRKRVDAALRFWSHAATPLFEHYDVVLIPIHLKEENHWW